MRKAILIILLILVSLLAFKQIFYKPSLSPKEIVKLYLEELEIFKDPFYEEAALDKLTEDSEAAKRYVQAVKTLDNLIWTDRSSVFPKRRRDVLLTCAVIITSEGYEIIDERIEGKQAFVTVIFKKTSLFNLNLGKMDKQDSPPTTYELVKTLKGWKIKDIDGILVKRGL